jgi:uncharacterized phage protein (TIGR02218 family)
MSYATIDVSVQDGTPEYRLLFQQGATAFRYTSRPEIVSDGVNTWLPAAIKTTEVSQSSEMAKDPVTMRMPRDNALAQTFINGAPDDITLVTIFRSHIGDDVVQTYWKGRVAGFSVSGDEAEIVCENIFTSLRRSGLRARYQRGCRHALYSTGCGMVLANFAVEATVSAVSGLEVTFTLDEDSNGFVTTSNGTVQAVSGYFTGGIMQAADGMRYISSHVPGTLTLMQASNSLAEAILGGPQSVTLYPGCSHTIADCRDKFSNLINFGGFPWLPSKNPFANNVTGSIT